MGKDADGTIHRFALRDGETHWSGSTAGRRPIDANDIPNEILKGRTMIVGNTARFAIESGIMKAYERWGFLALGFFVLHIAGNDMAFTRQTLQC